jgi:hypothetical protein
MTEARDITGVAAAGGAQRGFGGRMAAEALDQLGRIGQRHSTGDEWCVHAAA